MTTSYAGKELKVSKVSSQVTLAFSFSNLAFVIEMARIKGSKKYPTRRVGRNSISTRAFLQAGEILFTSIYSQKDQTGAVHGGKARSKAKDPAKATAVG